MISKDIIGILGGDARQIYAINEFIKNGYCVYYYGISDAKISSEATMCRSMKDVLINSSVIVCPVPFSKDGKTLFKRQDAQTCEIAEMLEGLHHGHTVFGGNIKSNVSDYCLSNSITCLDLMNSDSFCLLNAIATAEGTIAEAIKASVSNLHRSNCLVIGYGRCAKILAKKLYALDCNVTIAARKRAALTEASAYGYQTSALTDISCCLSEFDFIFNTVPALVLNKTYMPLLKKEAVILDIASAPGGVDFDAAKQNGIFAEIYPGLPGKYSPKTSGEIIASSIISILNNEV